MKHIYITKPEDQRKFFIECVDREPKHDDLDRTFCKESGKLGHQFCGFCSDHNKPRFICGCLYNREEEKIK